MKIDPVAARALAKRTRENGDELGEMKPLDGGTNAMAGAGGSEVTRNISGSILALSAAIDYHVAEFGTLAKNVDTAVAEFERGDG